MPNLIFRTHLLRCASQPLLFWETFQRLAQPLFSPALHSWCQWSLQTLSQDMSPCATTPPGLLVRWPSSLEQMRYESTSLRWSTLWWRSSTVQTVRAPSWRTLASLLAGVLIFWQKDATLTLIIHGRLGLACPSLVAPALPLFVRPWCTSLRLIFLRHEWLTVYQEHSRQRRKGVCISRHVSDGQFESWWGCSTLPLLLRRCGELDQPLRWAQRHVSEDSWGLQGSGVLAPDWKDVAQLF